MVGKEEKMRREEGGGHESLHSKRPPAFRSWEEMEVAGPLTPGYACLRTQERHGVPLQATLVFPQPGTGLLTQ